MDDNKPTAGEPKISIQQGKDYLVQNGDELMFSFADVSGDDIKAYVSLTRPNGSKQRIPVVRMRDGVFPMELPAQDIPGKYQFRIVIVSDALGLLETHDMEMTVRESVR